MLPTRQKRSESTRNRIVLAAREFYLRRPFQEFSIAELTVKAGISIGCFYGHFRSKEELALYLADRCFVDSIVGRALKEISKLAECKAPFHEVIRRFIKLAADTFEQNREILRAVAVTVRTSGNEELRRQILRANRSIHGLFREALLARKAELRHPDPEVAVDIAILSVSAALREVVLFQQPVSNLAGVSRTKFIEELTRFFAVYIGTDYKTVSRKETHV